MKKTKKVISVMLVILTIISICSTATTVFAAEYVEEQQRTQYFDSALSGYLKNIVDTENAVKITEKEEVDSQKEEETSALTVQTFSLRSVQSTATDDTSTDEEVDVDHSTLTLELENGKKTAYIFSEPISYIDEDGNLVYKDTSIIPVTDLATLNAGYTYQNSDNDYKMYFGADSSVGVLLCSDLGSEIKLIPNGVNVAPGYVSSKTIDDIPTPTFEYDGVYGVSSLLRYFPQLNGCKEEIILSSYDGVSRFEFTLMTGDCIAAINSSGQIEIIDENKNILDTLKVPYAYDSSGGIDMTSEHYADCTYELEKTDDGVYALTLVVPETFLTDESTVYPVVIDPTTSTKYMYRDASVYSAYPTSSSFYKNETNCFGKSSDYGFGRVYCFFNLPDDLADYATIESAFFWARETTGRTTTMNVRPYIVENTAWYNSMTWDTKPGYGDYTCSFKNINSASEDGNGVYWYKFNIKKAVKAWTSGTKNRGIVFVSNTEINDAGYLWRAFASMENSTSSYRPYAVITYVNDTTKPVVKSWTLTQDGETISSSTWTNKDILLTLEVVEKDDDGNDSDYPFYTTYNNWTTEWENSITKTVTKENQTQQVLVRDSAGNISDMVSIPTKIDKTAPTISKVNNPKNGVWTNANVTVSITATDALSGVASYSFNGGTSWQSGSSKNYTAEGTYTVSAKAKDVATNISGAVSGGTVKIDKTAPVINSVTLDPTTWTNESVTITVNATDALSGVAYYSFDGGTTWQADSTYVTYGNATFNIVVKDNAGNTTEYSENPVSVTNIDKTSPEAVAFRFVEGVNNEVWIEATDELSGLHDTAYSFDGGATWQSKYYLDATGIDTFNIQVRDSVNNVKSLIYNANGTVITYSHPMDEWTNEDVTITVTGEDVEECDFGEGFTTNNTCTLTEDRIFILYTKNSDGDITSYGYIGFLSIDKVLPTITDVTISADDWTDQDVTITVTASDDDSKLDTSSAYSFDGGATWQSSNAYTVEQNTATDDIIIAVRDNANNISYYQETENGVSYTATKDEATPININFIDKTIPAAPDIYEENGLVYIVPQDFVEGTAPETVQYSLDGTNWVEYAGALDIVRTYGAVVYARVIDEAGNASQIAELTLENNLGEYTASYSDIAFGEGLFPVGFDRTYTSTKGWFFTFEANIVSDGNAYIFTDFYGEKQYFINSGDGKFESADGEELTITVLDETTTYSLNYGDMVCEFGADGKLAKITTDYTTTEYTWNADGTLTITGGATVTFTDGKPTKINITRDADNFKEVEYEWTDGNLTKFIDAAGVSYEYAYNENGLLTTNDTETITYSANGRVKLISQPNGAFVKYAYNDIAENTETPNNIGVVTVSDSKGVTDVWYYADGVYISNTLDGYSDNAVYAPESISNVLTEDNIDDELLYVVETPQEDESSDNTETVTEDTSTDETTEGETTEESTTEDASETEIETATEETTTPLYEELDEDTYIFYGYDEQNRVVTELEVLKANVTDITAVTLESAEAIAENKITYKYVSETDDNVEEQQYYEKSENTLALKEKECYTYDNNNVKTYEKYMCESSTETLVYSAEYEYDSYGNVSAQTETQYATALDAYDVTYTTSYKYDIWNQCVETTVTTAKKADDGSVEYETTVTATTYDKLGRTTVIEYDGEKTSYAYDVNDNVISETVSTEDGADDDKVTTYTYSDNGNLVSKTNPNATVAIYSYDDYGNLIAHDYNGYAFTYNTLGSILTASVIKKTVDENEVETVTEIQELVSYTYSEDTLQNVTKAEYANGQTLNYTYADGELTAVKQGEETKFSYSSETVDDVTITTLTDNINSIIKVIEENKVTVKTSDGKTDIYSVENLYEDEEKEGSFNGKKITVGTNVYTLKSEENKDTFLIGETEDFVKTSENDYDGNLWKVNTAGAVLTEYGYDENDNISSLINSLNGLTLTYEYGYDDNGNITAENLITKPETEDGSSNDGTNQAVTYTYDEDNQLLSAETSTIKYEYKYLDGGNIEYKKEYSISINENGEKVYTLIEDNTDTYVYDENWKDKLISYNGQTITYDTVGNPIEYLGNTLTWTMGRQLSSFGSNTYTYNEDGIRTSKTIDGVTTTYYLDGTNIIEQSDGTNTLHFHYDSSDEIIGFTYNETDYFYVKNSMGDIVGIADSSGNLVVSYDYDAWGDILSISGNTEIGNINPFRYRSYYYDSDIQMYYLQSRYYDPEVGRFINCDDVNFIGYSEQFLSYNPFAYCENNPVNKEDPNGCADISDFLDLLGKVVDFIAQIVSLCEKLSEKNLNKIKAIGAAAMNSKQKKNYKAELQALEETKRLSKILGVVGYAISLASLIRVFVTTKKKTSSGLYAFAAIVSEITVELICRGISWIVGKLCKFVPYVGFLLKSLVSIGASYILKLYFTAERVYRIGQSIYRDLKNSPYMSYSLTIRKVFIRTLV